MQVAYLLMLKMQWQAMNINYLTIPSFQKFGLISEEAISALINALSSEPSLIS